MLTRRSLLSGVALATLTGCGVLPAGGLPSPALPPDPSVPGHEALHRVRTALTEAVGALTGPAAALVEWALDVSDDQFRATSLAPPATPAPPASPSPPPSPSPGTTGDAVPALVAVLTDAATDLKTQALDATSARPLVWASIAAWCTALAAHLPDATVPREPARGFRLPAPQEPDAALQAAVDAASAAHHGLQVAAGAPGLAEEEVAALRRRIAFWAQVREDLTTRERGTTASPTPGPPWYTVPAVEDATAGRALAARLQASVLPVLGRTLAHGPAELRPTLVDALGDAAADVPRWGGLLERWPGLPTS